MNLNELIEPFNLLNQEQIQKAALKPPKKRKASTDSTPAVEKKQGKHKGKHGTISAARLRDQSGETTAHRDGFLICCDVLTKSVR